MTKDTEIKSVITEIALTSKGWVDYVRAYNQCAYIDRGIETIIQLAKQLEKLHDENTI